MKDIKARRPIHDKNNTKEDPDKSNENSSSEENTDEEENELDATGEPIDGISSNSQPQTSGVEESSHEDDPVGNTNCTTCQSPQFPSGMRLECSDPNLKETRHSEESTTSGLHIKTIILYALVPVSAILLVYYSSYVTPPGTVLIKSNCTYSELEKKYPNQDKKLWKHLTTGVENILQNKDKNPAVYLLMHSGHQEDEQLINDIVNASLKCFSSEDGVKTINLHPTPPISDHGSLIEKYKTEVKEGNVVFIANLNKVPSEAARALHTICDTHSPIINKVVIFLSLEVDRESDKKPVDIATDTLKNLWSNIPLYQLDPIITRVTDEVLMLRSE